MDIKTINRLRKIAEDSKPLTLQPTKSWGTTVFDVVRPKSKYEQVVDQIRAQHQFREMKNGVPQLTSAKPGFYTPTQGYNRGNTIYSDAQGNEMLVRRGWRDRLDTAFGVANHAATGLLAAVPNDVMDLGTTAYHMLNPNSYRDFNPFNDVVNSWDENYKLFKNLSQPFLYKTKNPASRKHAENAYIISNLAGQLAFNPTSVYKAPIKSLKYVPNAVKWGDRAVDAGQLGGFAQSIYDVVTGNDRGSSTVDTPSTVIDSSNINNHNYEDGNPTDWD